jgi:hypothetical protein
MKAKINSMEEMFKFDGPATLSSITDKINEFLNLDLSNLEGNLIEDILDINGNSVINPTPSELSPPTQTFTLAQHKPAAGETASSGPISSAILHGTAEYDELILNANPDLVYKNSGEH